jgi:hypothetical protein
MEPGKVNGLLRSGYWQPLRRGVYATFTGTPPRASVLWAAVLSAGPGAALSHDTAAELFEITDWNSSLIHITIPEERRIRSDQDVVLHHSRRVADAVHSTLLPPRTRVEETVLDIVACSAGFDAALGVVCAACQRNVTTPSRIAKAMRHRARQRWRADLTEALSEIGGGVHSLLEHRYVHRVERPHGLPAATRQAPVAADRRMRYLDNLYGDYGLCVELDGQQAHPDHRRWDDLRRVNAIAERGVFTLRYGWTDVDRQPCRTAAQIGAVLGNLGWPGPLRPCNPGCPAVTRR